MSDHDEESTECPPSCVNRDISIYKFGTTILCNVTKKMAEKLIQNCSYRDDNVTNFAKIFENLCKKRLKYIFSKINLVAVRKLIFKNFFQLLKGKITHKLNTHRLIC